MTDLIILFARMSQNILWETNQSIIKYRCNIQISPHNFDPARLLTMLHVLIEAVQGRFEPPVTVIMLSPGVTGTSRHLGFASESSLLSSRFQLDPNMLSG